MSKTTKRYAAPLGFLVMALAGSARGVVSGVGGQGGLNPQSTALWEQSWGE